MIQLHQGFEGNRQTLSRLWSRTATNQTKVLNHVWASLCVPVPSHCPFLFTPPCANLPPWSHPMLISKIIAACCLPWADATYLRALCNADQLQLRSVFPRLFVRKRDFPHPGIRWHTQYGVRSNNIYDLRHSNDNKKGQKRAGGKQPSLLRSFKLNQL